MDVHKGLQVNFIQEDKNIVIYFRSTNDKEVGLLSNYVDHTLIEDDFWNVLFNLKPIIKDKKQSMMVKNLIFFLIKIIIKNLIIYFYIFNKN